MIRKVHIHDRDYGFLSQEPITVQRFETRFNEDDFDKELIWCNHAGAEEIVQENSIFRLDAPDIVWNDKVLVCKCGAYKFQYDDFWQDAPLEGIR